MKMYEKKQKGRNSTPTLFLIAKYSLQYYDCRLSIKEKI